MWRLENPTYCVNCLDRFDSIFALFPWRTRLSNFVSQRLQLLGLKSWRSSV